MFGTLRLILAAAVAAFHAGARPGGLWIGVTAVVVFFMISGYAMTGLLQARFSEPSAARFFFLDRIIRLSPQYYVWLAVTLFCLLVLHWQPIDVQIFWHKDLISYLTLIPLALQPYTHMITLLLIPQASSLGMEIIFYLLSPWMLTNKYLAYGAGLISLGIFLISAFGLVMPNLYTYYTAPGPIIFYLIGSFLYRNDWRALVFFVSTLLMILGSALAVKFNAEMALGVVLGLPILWSLRRFKAPKWDDALGNASYGCFLVHATVIWGLQYYGILATNPLAFQGTVVLIAVALGSLSFLLLERPTIPFRRRFRMNRGLGSGSAKATLSEPQRG